MKRIYFAALVGLFGCVSVLSAQGRSELLLEKKLEVHPRRQQ